MISKQRIEEAATTYAFRRPELIEEDAIEAFTAGANWAAQEIMSKASEGFEEWFLHYPSWDTAMSRQNSCEVAWQAAKISSEKEIQQLKEAYCELSGQAMGLDHMNGLNSEMVEQLKKENEQLKQRLDKSTDTLVSHKATIGFLKDALQDIADEDYRGNRSSGSVKAYQALQKLKPRTSLESDKIT